MSQHLVALVSRLPCYNLFIELGVAKGTMRFSGMLLFAFKAFYSLSKVQ
jgi:hypothetical protein